MEWGEWVAEVVDVGGFVVADWTRETGSTEDTIGDGAVVLAVLLLCPTPCESDHLAGVADEVVKG